MWHVSHGDKNFGPFAEDKMLALIKAGKLPPTVYVWKAGMAEWIMLRDSSLMQSAPAVAPPVAAAPVMAQVVAPAAAANPFDFTQPAARNPQSAAAINVAVSAPPTAQQLSNPYFSDFRGNAAPVQTAAIAANPHFRWLPLQGRQAVVIVTTAIAGVLSLVCAWLTYQQTGLLQRMLSGAYGKNRARALADAEASDAQFMMFFLIYTAATLAMSIAFLVWFYRAHVNAKAMSQVKFADTSGLAVGFFFIPIMNLFKPFVGMRDIWRGSFTSPGSFAAPPSTLVGIWWAAWISMNFLNRFFVFGFASRDPSIKELITLSNISMIGNVLMIVPFGLTVLLVLKITKQQARKALQISQGIGQPQQQKPQPQVQLPEFQF